MNVKVDSSVVETDWFAFDLLSHLNWFPRNPAVVT